VIGAFWNSDSVRNYRECLEEAGGDQAALADCEDRFRDDVERRVS
jgi:hypothetical protein